MKTLRFTGQQPTVFHDIGELVPGEVRTYFDKVANALLERGEFEVVVKPQPKPAVVKAADAATVSKNASVPSKLEADKTTGKP